MEETTEAQYGEEGIGIACEKTRVIPISDKLKKREVILVFGKPGMGKTYYIKTRVIKQYPRVLIFNPNETEEYKNVVSFDDIDALIEYCADHQVFRCRLTALDQFPDLCLVAKMLTNTCLVIEEAHRFIPARETMPQELRDLFYQGRHWRVSIVVSTPRPGALSVDLRSVYTKIVAFNQSEPRDIEWIERAGGCVLDDLSGLPQAEYYEITNNYCEHKSLDDLKKLLTS